LRFFRSELNDKMSRSSPPFSVSEEVFRARKRHHTELCVETSLSKAGQFS
jgi:hypothetical protein